MADEYLYRPSSGVFSVAGHGEGHGRGMSQYGAQGAASIGKTAAQILDFYYPGTASTAVSGGQLIRVWISKDTDNVTEVIAGPGLLIQDSVTGRVLTPPSGTSRVAATPTGTGYVITVLVNGAWRYLDTSENPAQIAERNGQSQVSDASVPSSPAEPTGSVGPDAPNENVPAEATDEPTGTSETTSGITTSGSIEPSSTTVPSVAETSTETLDESVVNSTSSTALPPGLRSDRTAFATGKAPQTTPGAVNFLYASYGPVELVTPTGDRVGYRGIVQAARNGAGSITINYVSLDNYVQGVVPRESPASWLPAALQSQAVAARTYAYNNIVHPISSRYDICDTAACQVYGGASLNWPANPNWNAASTNSAVLATAGTIRTYNGQPINAQFGSTNGGWTVDGRVPYLPAQPDPWESLANPPQSYANWKGELRVSELERRFPGIGAFTRMRITQRDGNGEWGGRVTAVVLEGSGGQVGITGDQLRLALDAPVRSAYFQVFDDAAAHNPTGSLDRMWLLGNSVSIGGWGFDPDFASAPLQVHIYDYRPDGAVNFFSTTASAVRPDVGLAYPAAGPAHGFDTTIPITGRGTHYVCVYLINQGQGTQSPSVGCRYLTIGPPIGSLDGIGGAPGQVTVSGWALDPEAATSPISVHLYDTVGPRTAIYTGVLANLLRTDVAAAYPGTGSNHGFNGVIRVTEEGVHRICAYAINAKAPYINPSLGCRDVMVANPIGSLDSVSPGRSMISMGGWTFDPKDPLKTVQVHVALTGPSGTSVFVGYLAQVNRPDVARVYPAAGQAHGYQISIPGVAPGSYRVCAYAITTGAGTTNPELGCRSVQVG